MAGEAAGSFAKTICSICYEDLKPIIEDLQAISVCGHVFHELCLQQWFDYCPRGKKCSCPVCKQVCASGSMNRLYFQSIGDQIESTVAPRKGVDCAADAASLRGEVTRLEGKLSGISSVVECQAKEIKQLNEELYICRDQLKKETSMRTDALEQKGTIHRLLLMKSQELDMLKLESLKLQDRNLSLAKELAALKLVSDLDLEEDEILKLASFGNDANSKDTIDILRKSLVVRNKSYKELMAKCNQLGRGESHALKKLEKAKERINVLKTRLQELEMTVERKDNQTLRTLNLCQLNRKDFAMNGSGKSTANKLFPNEQKIEQSSPIVQMDSSTNLAENKENCSFLNITNCDSVKQCPNPLEVGCQRDDDLEINNCSPKPQLPVNKRLEHLEYEPFGSSNVFSLTHNKIRKASDVPSAIVKQVIPVEDTAQLQPILNIKKDGITPAPLSKPGDICFSGGLLGPDGTRRYLGKWCKRSQGKSTVSTESISASSGDLIAVGADGRGGRIKVLRSLNQSPFDDREISVSTKRYKHGGKQSGLQSQGNLQIEHFFGKSSH